MKKITLIITVVVFTLNVFSQAPNWEWAKSAGGTAADEGYSVSTDASGNVFMTGRFNSPTITFGTTTLTTAGGPDIFIVKQNALGNVLWAKSAGGTAADEGYSVSTDASGNVFMTGRFNSPTITFGTTTLTNAGADYDIFIVKYDAAGNVLWAKSAGGISGDVGYSVSTDASGNVFMTGYFKSPTITFGTTTLTNVVSYPDIFIVKYDSSGNVLWAKSAGGANSEYGASVSTDASGNLFMSGYFISATLTFGTTTLTNAGGYDIFIVKYDAAGNVLWAKSAGGTSDDNGYSVSTDASGNVFMTGSFSSPSITFGTTTLTNSGGPDICIVKYDAAGNVLWAKSAGGTSADVGYGVSTDASGNAFMTGFFNSRTITFGTTMLTNTDTTGTTYDIFVAKENSNCFAHYTTVYDSTLNAFTLNVDTATSALAIGYHWDFGDGTTSTLVNPSHIYAVDTVYNVCMKIYTATGDSCEYCHIIGKDWLGNIYRTAGFTLNVQNTLATVGVSQYVPKKQTVTISPNPFTSQTTITFNEEQKNTIIKIMDVLGNTIQQSTISSRQSTIDMSGYAKGIYFVRIEDEKKNVVNRKMVKN